MINLDEVLRLHGLWLAGKADGARADLRGADLRGADLRGAVLRDAVLTGADLRGADLRDAVLTGVVLRGADLGDLTVESLHIKMLALLREGGTLEMSAWHLNNAQCGTQHCRAGWAIHLAGGAGAELEAAIGPAAAGAVIISLSCPYLERVPNFYANNDEALADIERCAAIEAIAGGADGAAS